METAASDFRFALSNVVRIYTTWWSARGKRCGDENTILKSVAIDLCTLTSLLRTKQEWLNWSIATFGLSVTKLLSLTVSPLNVIFKRERNPRIGYIAGTTSLQIWWTNPRKHRSRILGNESLRGWISLTSSLWITSILVSRRNGNFLRDDEYIYPSCETKNYNFFTSVKFVNHVCWFLTILKIYI